MWQRQSQRSPRARLVAHRGGEGLGGGDLLEAARRLVALGLEMVEIDVRRTRDGVLVIHHDDAVRGAAIGDLSYDDGAGVSIEHPQNTVKWRALGDSGSRKIFHQPRCISGDTPLFWDLHGRRGVGLHLVHNRRFRNWRTANRNRCIWN